MKCANGAVDEPLAKRPCAQQSSLPDSLAIDVSRLQDHQPQLRPAMAHSGTERALTESAEPASQRDFTLNSFEDCASDFAELDLESLQPLQNGDWEMFDLLFQHPNSNAEPASLATSDRGQGNNSGYSQRQSSSEEQQQVSFAPLRQVQENPLLCCKAQS